MNKTLIFGVLALASACVLGQVDRSKEAKPIVTDKPAVEHFYSCPEGYELKQFVQAIPAATATNASGQYWSDLYTDHYQTALPQDIVRTGEPTCVPKPPPSTLINYNGIVSCCTAITVPTTDGKFITMHLDTGKIDIPAGYSMDKSAKEFWDAMKRYANHETGLSK